MKGIKNRGNIIIIIITVQEVVVLLKTQLTNINIATSSKQQIVGRRGWREKLGEKHGKDEETKDMISVRFK